LRRRRAGAALKMLPAASWDGKVNTI